MESAFSVEQLVMFLAVLAMTVYFLRNRWLLYRFEKIVEKQITKKMLKRQRYRPVEEVLNLNDEYGVAEFVVEENSKLTGKTLLESGLKQRFIQVLNIDKGDKIIHFPRTDYVFYPGDKVLVYGQIDNIKKLVSNLNSEAEE
jgi:Trk K+ transport system NAD-binding subunit